MFRSLRLFSKDPLIRYSLLATGVLIFAQLVVLTIGIKERGEPISLHYTTRFGVDFVGAWFLAYLLPLGSLFVLMLNASIAYYLIRYERLLGYFLTVGAAFVAALLLIQSVLIVRLNS